MRTYCVMATARSKKRMRVVLSIASKIALVDRLKRGEANVKLAAESVRSRRMKLRYDRLPRRWTPDSTTLSKGRKVMRLAS